MIDGDKYSRMIKQGLQGSAASMQDRQFGRLTSNLQNIFNVVTNSSDEALNIYSVIYQKETNSLSYGLDFRTAERDMIKLFSYYFELLITTNKQGEVRFKHSGEYVKAYEMSVDEKVYQFAISGEKNQPKITVNEKVILNIESIFPLKAYFADIRLDSKVEQIKTTLGQLDKSVPIQYQFIRKSRKIHRMGDPYIVHLDVKKRIFESVTKNIGTGSYIENTDLVEMDYMYSPIRNSHSEIKGLVVLEIPPRSMTRLSEQLLRSIITGFSFLAIFSMLAAIFFARKITDPLDQLTLAISRLIKNDFSFKLSAKGFGGFGFLADQFNLMLTRVQKSREELIQLNKSYSRFVPHQLLKQLSAFGVRDISLGDCTEIEMTVLFCDIRGFTTISESMSPQANFNFINRYLSRIAPVINKRGGIIDKYLGDGIMALFPNGADQALIAGLEMLKALEEYNVELEKKHLPAIKVGLGLHSGKMMLGAVGTSSRMDATVVSDAVNAAARVEALTKSFCTEILITDETKKLLTDLSSYNIRYIAACRIRGKSKPMTLYEVYNNDSVSLQKEKAGNQAGMIKAWRKYREGDVAVAIQMYREMIEKSPNDPSLFALIERCQTGRL